MRATWSTRLVSVLALCLPLSTAINLNCDTIVVSRKTWDISPLSGVHYVYDIRREEGADTYENITFAFDLCKTFTDTRVPEKSRCEPGVRVCAYMRTYKKEGQEGEPPIEAHWPVAGEFLHGSGKHLDPYIKELGKDNADDEGRDGLEITLNGGTRVYDNGHELPQRAIIDLVCDKDTTGVEDGEAAAVPSRTIIKRDDGDDEPDQPKETIPAEGPLQFRNYSMRKFGRDNEEFDVLRATWRTKYACSDLEPEKSKEHWGFFTWLVIIVFLLIASYLIFGSWLNFSRHGARGWDLLPHGDTIREIPYILKDISRRVVNTVQGGGRGGYNEI